MKRRLILLLAPAALLLTTIANAQPAPTPNSEPRAHLEAMHRQHVEDLKTILRLRPDQEPALVAFADAHRPQSRLSKAPRDARALTTPERLDDMSKREAETAGRHQQARDALARFYAALSPEQQKVFDALQRLKAPHGGPGGPMMMHGGAGARRMMMRHHGGPEGDEPPR